MSNHPDFKEVSDKEQQVYNRVMDKMLGNVIIMIDDSPLDDPLRPMLCRLVGEMASINNAFKVMWGDKPA